MNEQVESVRSKLREVEKKVEAAMARSGRADRPRLLVASKYLGVDDMDILARAGIRLVGENRASELEAKWKRWERDFEFHFIGHLQRRKVPTVLPRVTLIHSVDSISLVEELDRRAESGVKVLLEVNVSGEETKDGVLPEAASAFLQRAKVYRKIEFLGLMTMAPLASDPETVRPCFRELRNLRDRLAEEFNGRYGLTELSMGMSNDYEVAVEEGATIIRLGSALLATV